MSDITVSKTGMSLTLADGQPGYINHFWLRNNCASCTDQTTQERTYRISDAPDDLHPTSAHVADGTLHVTWSDGGHKSQYDLGWITNWVRQPGRADEATLPRRYWKGDHYDNIQRFDFAELLVDNGKLVKFLEALLVEGIGMITGMPSTDDALPTISQRVGIIRPCLDHYIAGSYIIDVVAKPEARALGYTDRALELHTDAPSEDLVPGIGFLQCCVNTVTGGESLFVDAVAVAADFRRDYPEDFAILAETDIPYRYRHDAFDQRRRHRVIQLDQNGEIAGITLSAHQEDTLDFDQHFLDRFYPALMRFTRMIHDQPENYLRFRLNAGECAVWDNHTVCHGREAFDWHSGERRLRLCYIDRGDWKSQYRTLFRQERAKSQAA